MSLTSILDGLRELVKQEPLLFASRYLTGSLGFSILPLQPANNAFANAGVAVTILIYDHALTFGDEVRFMWKKSQESWFARMNYFITRYTAEGIMIFVAYGLSRALVNVHVD